MQLIFEKAPSVKQPAENVWSRKWGFEEYDIKMNYS